MYLQYVKNIEAILLAFRTRDLSEINGQAQANCKTAKHATINLCRSFSIGRYKSDVFHVILAGGPRKTHETSGRQWAQSVTDWTKIRLFLWWQNV